MLKTMLIIAFLATGVANAGEWVVNRIIGKDRVAPAISEPNYLDLAFTTSTGVKPQGLGNETRMEVHGAFRAETDAKRLRWIRMEYNLLLESPTGKVYIKRGFANRREETVVDINHMKTACIQKFKVAPNTKVVGFYFALFHRNNFESEKKWLSVNMKDRGYANTWYKN